jgi:hypothetical protein
VREPFFCSGKKWVRNADKFIKKTGIYWCVAVTSLSLCYFGGLEGAGYCLVDNRLNIYVGVRFGDVFHFDIRGLLESNLLLETKVLCIVLQLHDGEDPIGIGNYIAPNLL